MKARGCLARAVVAAGLAVVVMLSVPLGALGALTAGDFSGLKYDDAKKDDYTFYFEGKTTSDAFTGTCGVMGKVAYVDIVRLEASCNDATGKVTVTLTLNDALRYGSSVRYYACFVKPGNQQCDGLLRPQDLHEGWINFDYYEQSTTYVDMRVGVDLEYGTVCAVSSDDIPSLNLTTQGATATFTMNLTDLEDAGVLPGFGMYAYCCLMGTDRGSDKWTCQVSWDCAGVGAAPVPAEFNKSFWARTHGGETPASAGPDQSLLPFLLLVVILAAAGGAGGYLYTRRKKARAAAPPASAPQAASQEAARAAEEEKELAQFERKQWEEYEKMYGRPHPDKLKAEGGGAGAAAVTPGRPVEGGPPAPEAQAPAGEDVPKS